VPIERDISSVETAIALSVPEFHGNEWKYVKECLDTGWVSSAGPFVDRFERELAAYVGTQYAVAVVNGTAALHTALKVIGLQPDEEVIVSDLTFVAPVNAIRYCQAYPILMDAHPDTWQIDPEKVAAFLQTECEVRAERCFNRRTGRRVRAILPVHILGLACEMEQIIEVARRFHLKVVEDAAEAVGVRYQGRHVGTFGDVGVFSFNGNKIITAGGGGMVVTNDLTYADYARYITTQAKDDPLEYVHNEVGYNYRLTNIHAALGVAQLEQINDFIARKRAIARAYREAFCGLGSITPMPSPGETQPTYWLYSILLDQGTSLARRKTIIRYLNENGVDARPFWHTIHDLPPYRQCQSFKIEHSVRVYERGVSLPCSVGLESHELKRCIAVLKQGMVK
jgi:perosamine synthetase